MLSPTDKLLAIEEIKNLKARYFRFLDSQDWAGFRGLFRDDAVFSLPKKPKPDFAQDIADAGTDEIRGADAFVAWASKSLTGATSAHLGYMPEIEIISADEARGLWGMEDIVRWPGRIVHGYGYYRESYRRDDGGWRIKSWGLFYKSMEVNDLATTNTRVV